MTSIFAPEPPGGTPEAAPTAELPDEVPAELPEEITDTGELARRAFRYLNEPQLSSDAEQHPSSSPPAHPPTAELARLAFGDAHPSHHAAAVEHDDAAWLDDAARGRASEHAAAPLTRRQRAAAAAARASQFGHAALTLAIVALLGSFFFGWFLPLALVAVALAAFALRRRAESRAIAIWALCLGLLATVFSIGWLIWLMGAVSQGG